MRTLFRATMFCVWIAGAIARCEAAPGEMQVRSHFTRTVANIEIDSNELFPDQPKQLHATPANAPGALWFGRISRRRAGTPLVPGGMPRRGDILFAVCYRETTPIALWCDSNMNNDLSDDPPVLLHGFTGPPETRAGIVDVAWEAPHARDRVPVQWKIRIVLEPFTATPPRFRIQMIYGMEGSLAVDGQLRRAFLYDGNRDGLYTMEYGDGLFVDANGDSDILVDPSGDEFIPFGASAQIGRTSFRTTQVALDGSDVTMEVRGDQDPLRKLVLGEEAPDFEFEAVDGRHIRLSDYRGRPVIVYFWASWCGACVEEAPALHALYDRFHRDGLELLAISFDHDRQAALDFVRNHDEHWPVAYSGRPFWENPIGRLYGVVVAGSAYVIDHHGRFAGAYGDLAKLEHDLPVFFLYRNGLPPLVPAPTMQGSRG